MIHRYTLIRRRRRNWLGITGSEYLTKRNAWTPDIHKARIYPTLRAAQAFLEDSPRAQIIIIPLTLTRKVGL